MKHPTHGSQADMLVCNVPLYVVSHEHLVKEGISYHELLKLHTGTGRNKIDYIYVALFTALLISTVTNASPNLNIDKDWLFAVVRKRFSRSPAKRKQGEHTSAG